MEVGLAPRLPRTSFAAYALHFAVILTQHINHANMTTAMCSVWERV